MVDIREASDRAMDEAESKAFDRIKNPDGFQIVDKAASASDC